MPETGAPKASSSTSSSATSSILSASDKLLLSELARSAGLDLRPRAVSALADALSAGAPPPSLATVLGALCKNKNRGGVSVSVSATSK